jgi:hypothetical protein
MIIIIHENKKAHYCKVMGWSIKKSNNYPKSSNDTSLEEPLPLLS